MGKLIDRAKERIGRVKADRSTAMGIAGHQAAMQALSSASGHGRRGGDSSEQSHWVYTGTEPDLLLDKDEDGPLEPSGVPHLIDSKIVKKSRIEPDVIDRHKPTEDF